MKKTTLLASLFSASLLLAACGGESVKSDETTEAAVTNEGSATTYKVNPENSTVNWKGEVLGVYSHTGTLKISEGSFSVKEGKVSEGNFTVDMTSMSATDDNYNEAEGKTKEKLIGHLSSPDFFDVASSPTASFVVKSVNESGEILGDLTIRGVTKEAKVTNVSLGEGTASGTLVFNRQDYGVAWAMSAKDMVLGDDIELIIKLATNNTSS